MENTNQIAVAVDMGGVVEFSIKSGSGTISAEGALFKGGAALAALKDMALEIALKKAVNGKYRAAADVLAAAFPSTARAFEKLYNVEPWSNKANMKSFVAAVGNARPGRSGEWNKKQVAARSLMMALSNIPAFAPERGEIVEVEAATV